jgi:hypothetical protein
VAWAGIPGVAAVEPIEGEVEADFVLRGVDVHIAAAATGALAGEPDLQRRYVDDRLRTLVASRRLAQKKGWRPGSIVNLRDKNGVPVTYEVLLVSDASGFVPDERAFAVTSPHWLRRDWCIGEQCVQHATLRLQPAVNGAVLGGRVREAEPRLVRYKTDAQLHRLYSADVDRDFYIFDLLLLWILALAGTGLLNGMTIAALGRVRELGVLQALGVSQRTLRTAMLLEGLLVGALAAVLALGLTLPMARLLVQGLNQVAALEAPLVLPVSWMAAVPLLSLATGVAAALLPAARAARIDPAEAVRCD